MNKTKNDTLIILTPGFPENEDDTTCLPFLQNHVKAINNYFPYIVIIIFAFQYPFNKKEYFWNGNQVFCGNGKDRPGISRYAIWIHVWRKLKHIRKTERILGILSLWCTECAIVGSHFGKLYSIKHLNWLCGQDAKAGNRYIKFIRPQSEELIAMSDFLKREFYKNYSIEPKYVIPIGVAPENFFDDETVRDIDVLGVGSLIPLKQYDVFVAVVRELAHHQPHINTIICGKGPEEAKLKSLIEVYGLGNNIILVGEIANADVLQLMKRTKVFLHTSNYEGFGTVCLEALCAGAHVVSFTKAMDRSIDQWHHVMDKEGMAKKVRWLLEDNTVKYEQVCPYSSKDIAVSMMLLFGI